MNDFDIVMLVPGMPFDGDTLKTRSLGGSESAALYMAQALARKGQHLTVFSNVDMASTDEFGVRYLPVQSFGEYTRATHHDVCIVQRTPEAYANVINSKLNMLWCHDLALVRSAERFKSVMWNVDGVMVLSDFMREQYKKVYGIPDSLVFQTRNGIDLPFMNSIRIPDFSNDSDKRVLYAARPERGLDILLRDIMPMVWAQDPDVQLRIASYDNPVTHLQDYYNSLRALADQYGEEKVKWLAPLTKEELYDEMQLARAYVYPTPGSLAKSFSEVSCIAAMEAQAMGLPIVTSMRGALPETIGLGAGVLVEGDPWTEDYQKTFAEAALAFVNDPGLRNGASACGLARATALAWDDVADDWIKRFEGMIRERNSDDDRLVRHAWRNSDIVLARQMLDETPNDELNKLLKPFDFAFNDGFAEQYAKIGETHNADVFEYIQRETRFQVLVDWLRTRDDIGSVLDYGCGLGGYAYYGSLYTKKKFTGVDIDPRTIEIARQKSAANEPADVSFRVGTHTDAEEFGTHDALLVQELLEHVRYPWEVINSLEQCVPDGGWVYITVPFGPWEYTSYDTYPHRCHIWHFDMHDLRDMFGGKDELNVDALYHSMSDELGAALGWWVVRYRKNGVPTGEIDMERKRWLQRPRQTVSVSMMAGPGSEENLHWCLGAMHHVADELVIADNGMSEEARRIAAQYQARIVPGADPRVVGFEVPRNISLGECSMDWVLWIDTDEKLINQVNVHKYLRNNIFNGYGVRQHHFACDTLFTPDMPVRLFRNNGSMRFYGMVHEHPELALNSGPGEVVVLADVHIAHVGYLVEATRQQRFLRNYPLLQKDQETYPTRVLQKHFIMRDNVQICRFELEHNGGRVTADIERRCREVIELYRKHFLGKRIYMGADSLRYYSDALSILGEGSEVAFQFDAAKDTADPRAGAIQYRFASKEDFVAEMTRRVDEKFVVLEDPYY